VAFGAPTHVCISARIRVVQAPPSGVFVNDLYAIANSATDFGVGGLRHVGPVAQAMSTYRQDGGETETARVPLMFDAAWHVVRVELDRGDAGEWLASVTLDGKAATTNTLAFPPGQTPLSGGLVFGPGVLNPLQEGGAGAAAVTDYADVRVDIRP
jgi:hypothetical protein